MRSISSVINAFRNGMLRRLAPVDARLERALGRRRSLTHVLACVSKLIASRSDGGRGIVEREQLHASGP